MKRTGDPGWVEKAHRERDSVRNEYPILFNAISQILFQADPVGVSLESNTDGYDPETGTIIPRLHECCSSDDVRRVIHEEFAKWFDEAMAGNVDRFEQVANLIWMEWQQHQNRDD